jgi:flagellar motility protein MotE (MotC chaperone)
MRIRMRRKISSQSWRHLVWVSALAFALSGEASQEDANPKKEPPQKTSAHSEAAQGAGSEPHAKAATHEEAKAVAAQKRSASSSCIVDANALEDLERAKQELEVKQQEFALKEKEMNAREKSFTEELKRLEQLRDEVGKVDSAKKKEAEERVAKLVETFETMSPKGAAQILANLDEGLAVSAMSKMTTLKLSKVMAAMDAKRSSRLTELMGGVARLKSDSSSPERNVASARSASEKGDRNAESRSRNQ